MARVTVEDCIEKVDTRFDLILLAAHRARAILSGAPLLVDRDNDKNAVVALREIEEDAITVDELKESLISNLQRVILDDDVREDDDDAPKEQEEETLALEHKPEAAPMSEMDMLKVLTTDRDSGHDNRY